MGDEKKGTRGGASVPNKDAHEARPRNQPQSIGAGLDEAARTQMAQARGVGSQFMQSGPVAPVLPGAEGNTTWKAADVVKKLRSCKGGEALWSRASIVLLNLNLKAEGGGPVVRRAALPSGIHGATSPTDGTIALSQDKSLCHATDVLAFELLNLIHLDVFIAVRRKAAAGDVAREAYYRAIAEQEHKNMREAIVVCDGCHASKWGCGTERMEHEDFRTIETFDQYFAKVGSVYSEHYGRQWDEEFKRAFEAKHPPKP